MATLKNVELNGTTDVVQIYSTDSAFAAIRADGSVITWGIHDAGGDSRAVQTQLDGKVDVKQIYSTNNAFAALRADGSVVTWGNSEHGGDSNAVKEKLVEVKQIYSTNNGAFAALRSDGSVVTWGKDDEGGDSSAVASQLDGTVDVEAIYSDSETFIARRADNSLVGWPQTFLIEANNKLDKSVAISEVYLAGGLAALRTDGSVIGWGIGWDNAVAEQLNGTTNVEKIYSTEDAFAALRSDGSVVTWGYQYGDGFGIDSSLVKDKLDGTIAVKQIYSTNFAFAALRTDGSVVTWGAWYSGGNLRDDQAQLDGTIDVQQIYSTRDSANSKSSAFAALRSDGSVVTWGGYSSSNGGNSDVVKDQLDGKIDVTQIYSTNYAFAALRIDGSVVTWGNENYGGDSSKIADQLDGSVDVVQIYSNDSAFVAVRADGSVITWGSETSGGDSHKVANQLDGTVDVEKIYSTDSAFAAVRADGSVVTWGNLNNPPTGTLKIYGKVEVGQTLTVENSVADVDGISGEFEYQWMANKKLLATGNSLTLTADEFGQKIQVVVQYIDNAGTSETVTSSTTSRVIFPNVLPTGNVVMVGDAKADQTLSVKSTLKDADGMGKLSYQWFSNGVAIENATQKTYKPTIADVDDKISVEVSYIDGLAHVTSIATAEQVIKANVTGITKKGNNLIVGTEKNDVLTGLTKADTLRGGGGNDVLYGDGANDSLDGGKGNDKLFGGAGNDKISGGTGNDKLLGNSGDDTLNGGSGIDTLEGGEGTNTAIFSGTSEDYSIHFYDEWSGESGLITNNKTGEMDEFSSIEWFSFSDDTLFVYDLLPEIPATAPLDELGEYFMAISDISVAEDNTTAVFTLKLDVESQDARTIEVYTFNGTAMAGEDYEPINQTVTFNAGETEKKIEVKIFKDTKIEPDETFFLKVEGENLELTTLKTVATILNDDNARPSLTITNTSIKEGNNGKTNVATTVKLSSPSADFVTVKYKTTDVTAKSKSDYSAVTGELTFAPNEIQKIINVPVLGDKTVEKNETFKILLSDATNAELGIASSVVTIVNDDGIGLVGVAA